MPEPASTFAPEVDWLFYFVLSICAALATLFVVLLLVFAIRYRYRGPDDKPMAKSPSHNIAMELTWTLIPTLIVLTAFYFGFEGYLNMAVAPPNTYEIQASGEMWKWFFTYPNGYVDRQLHVPKGMPVRLVLTSKDVIHDLDIPAFRVKQDVVPGRFNRLWFQASETGTFDVYCAEYCGLNHSEMSTKIIVHEPGDFDAWLEKASAWQNTMSPVQAGKMFFNTRGCSNCHTTDGSRLIGPSFKDVFGSRVQLNDGKQVLADENYIRESIELPGAKIVAGYSNVMPSYQGALKDQDIGAIVAWLKSQSAHSTPAPPATAPATEAASAPGADLGPGK